MKNWLLVYVCVDDGEEEACFLNETLENAEHYASYLPAPEGFEHRPGYYKIEEVEVNYGVEP